MKQITLRNLEKMKEMPSMELGPIALAVGGEIDIQPTAAGRFRLLSVLKNKYGAQYRNNPIAAKAIEHFDDEVKYARKWKGARGIS